MAQLAPGHAKRILSLESIAAEMASFSTPGDKLFKIDIFLLGLIEYAAKMEYRSWEKLVTGDDKETLSLCKLMANHTNEVKQVKGKKRGRKRQILNEEVVTYNERRRDNLKNSICKFFRTLRSGEDSSKRKFCQLTCGFLVKLYDAVNFPAGRTNTRKRLKNLGHIILSEYKILKTNDDYDGHWSSILKLRESCLTTFKYAERFTAQENESNVQAFSESEDEYEDMDSNVVQDDLSKINHQIFSVDYLPLEKKIELAKQNIVIKYAAIERLNATLKMEKEILANLKTVHDDLEKERTNLELMNEVFKLVYNCKRERNLITTCNDLLEIDKIATEMVNLNLENAIVESNDFIFDIIVQIPNNILRLFMHTKH